MNLTHICYDAKGIEKLGLDYIIVGSDEVWNYRETKGNAKVKFGIGLNNEKLIAYAPSVVRGFQEFSFCKGTLSIRAQDRCGNSIEIDIQ